MGKGKRNKPTRVLAFFSALSLYPYPYPLPGLSVRAARGDAALVSTTTREGRLAVFDDAWARINDRYYDQTFHGLDWDAQEQLFARAGSVDSSEELTPYCGR